MPSVNTDALAENVMTDPTENEPARIRNGRRIRDVCSHVNRKSAKRMQAALTDLRLSLSAYNLLSAIGTRNDMTIADARKRLGIESATVSTLVVRLEHDGLIERGPSPTDRRASLLRATDHALEVMQQAERVMAVEAADVTYGLSDVEQAELIRLLEKVSRNVRTR